MAIKICYEIQITMCSSFADFRRIAFMFLCFHELHTYSNFLFCTQCTCAKTVNCYFEFNGLIHNKKAIYELFRLAVRSNSAITMHMQKMMYNLGLYVYKFFEIKKVKQIISQLNSTILIRTPILFKYVVHFLNELLEWYCKLYNMFPSFCEIRKHSFLQLLWWNRSSEKVSIQFCGAKGQLISKGLLVSSNSSKKRTNEFVFLPNSTMIELFRSFFGGIRA